MSVALEGLIALLDAMARADEIPHACPHGVNAETALSFAIACLVHERLMPLYRGLKEPSLTRPGLVLYMSNPPALRKQTEANLKKAVGELCAHGDVLSVTEKYWHDRSLAVILRFKDKA